MKHCENTRAVIDAVTIIAIGSETHGFIPNFTTQSTDVYAPIPIKQACPMEFCPVMPPSRFQAIDIVVM